MKDKEYDTLRKEIMQWQAQRFAVSTGSIVVVFAILGWAINASDKLSWPVLSSVILGLLIVVAYVSWLFGLFTSRISTYLEVFHENDSIELGWERRHRIPRRHFLSTKGAYAALYLSLAAMSWAVSLSVCRAPRTRTASIVFGVFVVVFLGMLLVLVFRSHPWKKYLDQWQDIKDREDRDTHAHSSTQQLVGPERREREKKDEG